MEAAWFCPVLPAHAEHIEMPDFIADVVGHPVKLSFVKFFDAFNFVHVLSLYEIQTKLRFF
jgi:hypothetical protein